jgi:hypothetical protein
MKKLDNLTQDSLKDENCQQIIDKWNKFTDCLNKDDKTRFIEMIKEYAIFNIQNQQCQIKVENSIPV